MSFCVGEVDVRVVCEVTAVRFPLPGVTPPQALKEALWAAATAAGTNAGADTGSLLFLIAAAVLPGLRVVDVVDGQDENTGEAATLVVVEEDAEGGPARITPGIS